MTSSLALLSFIAVKKNQQRKCKYNRHAKCLKTNDKNKLSGLFEQKSGDAMKRIHFAHIYTLMLS